MTNLEAVRQLADRDWIDYGSGGVIHVQTIIEKEYPAPDVDQLCAVFDDHQGDWQEIIRDYERMDKESPNN